MGGDHRWSGTVADRILRARLRLADGSELRTISDALGWIERHFGATTMFDELDTALDLLATAADTGKRGDIKMATDHLVIVLRQARMM